ncbi:hypothetical protein [Enterococcus sp. BWR-S5]|uniref:hypothetical protein n=1 Tax=Enterococcus sp. BWR-S5 TaxID=2787714 RepID=UPI0019227F44|nr:hypothetical protein [Enterococcus sp. BWR-S5]MBL1226913.1 hypothetical protein [Enterococcus sp. BWR-S5]
MKRHRKQIGISVSIVLVLAVVSIGYFWIQKNQDKEESLEIPTVVIIEPREVTFRTIEGTTAIASKWLLPGPDKVEEGKKYSYVGSNPMATMEYMAYEDSQKLLTYNSSEIDPTVEVEKSLLHVYKRESNEIVKFKEIDMKQALANYNVDYAPFMTDGMLMIDGKSYVKINLYEKSLADYGSRWIYLGVEDEDIIENLAGKDTSHNRLYDIDSKILLSKYSNLSGKYIVDNTMWSSHFWYLSNTDMSTSGFLIEFPEMKKFLTLKDNERASIFFPDLSISVETIAKWFMPVGTDMYEGLVLYGEYSKDGQDHEIHSLEEFREWFKDTEDL